MSTDFRTILASHMRTHNITVAELARRSGYDYSGLHKWLSGAKADITLSAAARIFSAAGIAITVSPSRR